MNTKHTFLKLFTTTALICGCVSVPTLYADGNSEPVTKDFQPADISNGFADLVETIQPAVVGISVKGGVVPTSGKQQFQNQPPEFEQYFKRFFGGNFNLPGNEQMHPAPRNRSGVGSGFIIDATGLVVTNYHVVKDAQEINVVLSDGSTVEAQLKGADPKTDLALLQISENDEYPFVEFGDSSQAEIGDWVVAVGNPFGLGGTTTKGIISARGRNIGMGPLDDFIQIDAPINKGNSGGPLFNMQGEVIGVNSAIYSPNGGSVGIGFAIPSSMAQTIVSQIRENGKVEHGFIGVNIQTVTEDIADAFGLDNTHGALVTQVSEKSPAAEAKLESGDIILRFNDQKIEQMRELPRIVAMVPSGEKVDVVIWRDNKEKTLKLTVGSQNQAQPIASLDLDSEAGKLGMNLQNLDDNTRSKLGLKDNENGVVVSQIEKDSQVADQGISQGDIIKKVGKEEVSAPAEVNAAIKKARKSDKSSVLILVQKGDNLRYVAIPLEEQTG